jgi:hypothetical protein
MATVQTRINSAMQLIGQLAAGASPKSDETADVLVRLNAMLDSWRNEKLMVYAYQTETLTLANGDSSYTIGTSGDLNTTRPVAIERAWITSSNQDYPMTPLSEAEYAAIFDKTASADCPDRYLFRPTMASSLATFVVYPVPNATRTAKLVTRVIVSAFSAASDTVTLPPGWEEAIDANLAIRIAPIFETVASNDVKDMAREALAGIKRTNANAQPRRLYTELAVAFGTGNRGNILTDGM